MVATPGRIFFYIATGLFIGAVVYTFVLLGKVSAHPDNSTQMYDMIRTISLMNGALMALMTLIAFQYVKSDPSTGQSYVFLMLHFNIFLSLLAVSISVLSFKQRSQ